MIEPYVLAWKDLQNNLPEKNQLKKLYPTSVPCRELQLPLCKPVDTGYPWGVDEMMGKVKRTLLLFILHISAFYSFKPNNLI